MVLAKIDLGFVLLVLRLATDRQRSSIKLCAEYWHTSNILCFLSTIFYLQHHYCFAIFNLVSLSFLFLHKENE